jgi:hypothetical protein
MSATSTLGRVVRHAMALAFVAVAGALLAGASVAAAGSTSSPRLTAADHTLIMKAVMKNASAVTARVGARQYVLTGTSPPGTTILQAALTLPQIDDRTKARISAVLAEAQELQSVTLPPVEQAKVDAIDAQIDQQMTYQGLTQLLVSLRAQYAGDAGLAAGLDVGSAILAGGAGSIYCPFVNPAATACFKFDPYISPGASGAPVFFSAVGNARKDDIKKVAGDIVREDVKGAVQGGAKGGVKGAVAGAVVSSVSEVVKKILDWLFG